MRVLLKISILTVLLLMTNSVIAGDWRFGAQISYASGISDLNDQYERNLRAQNFIVIDVTDIPIGIGFKSRYETSFGLFYGIGVGPLFIIYGDADHYEVPVFGSVGYAFFRGSTFSPYLSLGAAYHIADGEFVESSDPGLLASVGVQIGKNWGIEAAVDESSVEIEVVNSSQTVDINTYDVIISVFALF